MRFQTLFPMLLLAGFLTQIGCASKPVLSADVDPVAWAWTKFCSMYLEVKLPSGLLLHGSFTYTSPKPCSKTNRTLIHFFGDLDGPLRIDVQSAVGTSLAYIRESKEGILAFYPNSHTAYKHRDQVIGAQRLGLPFPFSLTDLARLVCGDFSTLIPNVYDMVRPIENKGFEYNFKQGRVTSLVLDYMGNPMSMTGLMRSPLYNKGIKRDIGTWTVLFNGYSVKALGLSFMLTVILPGEENGVLRIKSREFKLKSWPEESLNLVLPEGTKVRRLDDYEAPYVFEINELVTAPGR